MKKITLTLATVLMVIGIFASYAHVISAPTNVIDTITYSSPTVNGIELELAKKLIDVPYIDQREKYPNGCEAVSCVMALNYIGVDISVDSFIDNYLDRADTPRPGTVSPDPDKAYLGDPRSEKGWGCNSPVIINALKKFLNQRDYSFSAHYGKSLAVLCDEYIKMDVPVIIWATVGMVDSSHSDNFHHWRTDDGKDVLYNRKLHCLVLCGYDEENYYFNDPMASKAIAYPKAACEKAYSILGMQSIVITKQ